jgi:phosphopantothenoylcysteine decarboxylase/phosphopantothenate--cysteine ligase
MILNNKKILLGVSGSIAAYKIAFLTRLLVKEGAEVKIVMTQAAKEFITPSRWQHSRKIPLFQNLSKTQRVYGTITWIWVCGPT